MEKSNHFPLHPKIDFHCKDLGEFGYSNQMLLQILYGTIGFSPMGNILLRSSDR